MERKDAEAAIAALHNQVTLPPVCILGFWISLNLCRRQIRCRFVRRRVREVRDINGKVYVKKEL